MECLSKTVDSAELDLICNFCVEMERRVKKALAERAGGALGEAKLKRIWDADIHYDDQDDRGRKRILENPKPDVDPLNASPTAVWGWWNEFDEIEAPNLVTDSSLWTIDPSYMNLDVGVDRSNDHADSDLPHKVGHNSHFATDLTWQNEDIFGLVRFE
jgi:hypothetical protein